jgi:hypothetical protein
MSSKTCHGPFMAEPGRSEIYIAAKFVGDMLAVIFHLCYCAVLLALKTNDMCVRVNSTALHLFAI